MSGDGKLECLSQRMTELEAIVFGEADKEKGYPKSTTQVVESLASVHSQLNAAVAGNKKIEPVLKRVPELEKCLDPEYTDQLTLSESAKADIVIAEEAVIKKHAENLCRVQQMLDVLNSEHIKGVPALGGKLHALGQVHIQQQDRFGEVSEEVKEVLKHYNNIVNLVSKQFAMWDEILTKHEIAAIPKKPVD